MEMSGQQHAPATLPTVIVPVPIEQGGTRWRSWFRLKSRVRFPMVSLEFFMTQSFLPHCGPGVDWASNRNEYQEYFLGDKGGRCVGLTILPPSHDACLETWEPQNPGTLRVCPVAGLDDLEKGKVFCPCLVTVLTALSSCIFVVIRIFDFMPRQKKIM